MDNCREAVLKCFVLWHCIWYGLKICIIAGFDKMNHRIFIIVYRECVES